jgi:hypothetical protein
MNSLGHISDGRCLQFGSDSEDFGVAGALVVAGMLDGTVSDTGDILSANFTSLSVLFTTSSSMVEATAGVGAFIGEGAGGAGSAGSTGGAGNATSNVK